jgi:phage baseplate assembly protein W
VPYSLPSTDPLGTDLTLDSKGDLTLSTSGSVFLISGADNVKQAINTFLTTLPYTYLWDDPVGTNLTDYIDAPITDQMKQEMTTIAQNTLMQDSRILSVQNVIIDDTQAVNTLVITIQATVSGYGPIEIPVVIGG